MRPAILTAVLALACCSAEPAGEIAEVRLIDPGSEPRRALRLDAPERLRQALRFSLSGRYEVTPAGGRPTAQDLRGLLVDLSAVVLARRDDGAMVVDLALERAADSAGDAEKLPDAGPGWLPSRLLGSTIRMLVSPRGSVLEGDPLGSQGPFVLFVPLPEEPVGVGARWQILGRASARGLPFEETHVFTLESIDAGRAEVGIEIRQVLAGHAGPDEALGIEILDWEGRGEGRAFLRLDAPLLDGAEVSWRSTSRHVLHQDAESLEVTNVIECDIRLTHR